MSVMILLRWAVTHVRCISCVIFFQAEDGIRDKLVTGVQTCALPIYDIKRETQQTWESQLGKIVVEDNNQTNKVNFYTAMYHSMLAPNLYQDVDGKYRGMDLKIHETNDFRSEERRVGKECRSRWAPDH